MKVMSNNGWVLAMIEIITIIIVVNDHIKNLESIYNLLYLRLIIKINQFEHFMKIICQKIKGFINLHCCQLKSYLLFVSICNLNI
jgi:hypothetical protein